VDRAYGFIVNEELLKNIKNSDKTANRWKNLDAKAILFFYRQSPRPIEVSLSGYSAANPPLQFPGEILVLLDAEGNLASLLAVPPMEASSSAALQSPNWEVLFSEAGLDQSQWTPTEARLIPPSFADVSAVWQGTLPNRAGHSIRIEAAAFKGRPISFEIRAPWIQAAQKEAPPLQKGDRLGIVYLILLVVAFIGGAIFFARRNVRLGRGDRRSASRLAFSIIGLSMISWALRAHHVLTVHELIMLFAWAGISICLAGLLWIFYIALEPFARRRWPQILVSWTRLLAGEWRDPLVARDVLAGCALGALWIGIRLFALYIVPSWSGKAEPIPPWPRFITALGSRFFLGELLNTFIVIAFVSLAIFCLLFIMRALLRNQKAAVAACVLVFGWQMGGGNFWALDYWALAAALVLGALWFFILIRFGLLAEVFAGFTAGLITEFLATLDFSAWYAGTGFAALAALAVIVLYAFRYSLGGRPLLAPSRLDD
jgi:hypothetical protein